MSGTIRVMGKPVKIDDWGHPFVILVYLAGAMVVTMLTLHPVLLGVSFCLATIEASFLWGRKMWKRWLGMALPVSFFMVVVMPLFSHHGKTPLFYVNGMAVTREAVCYGVVMSLLLSAIFQWFQIANFMLDSEKLLYLFGRILPSVGLLLSMVFRMIPLLGERFRQIRDAQRGMGRKQEQLSLPQKGRLLLKEISVLISWSLESSLELALSMENRGYGAGKRTFFSLFHFEKKDLLYILLLLLFYGICVTEIAGGGYAASFFPGVQIVSLEGKGIAGLIFFGGGALLPLADCLYRYR